MFKALTSSPATAAIVLALGIVGCTTAGLITGHLASADFMTVIVGIGAGGGVAAGAHIGGTTAANANAAPDPPVVVPGPAIPGTAAPAAVAPRPPAPAPGAAPVPAAG
jgi:hypothetical protein